MQAYLLNKASICICLALIIYAQNLGMGSLSQNGSQSVIVLSQRDGNIPSSDTKDGSKPSHLKKKVVGMQYLSMSIVETFYLRVTA